jgi:hypothetical protein
MSDHFVYAIFKEAGLSFEVVGPDHAGSVYGIVMDATGVKSAFAADSFDEACKKVDCVLEKNVPADHPDRFAGFRITIFDHEERFLRDQHIRTRGDLLRLFEGGEMPTLDELVSLSETAGDYVVRIHDGNGTLLLDRKDEVIRSLRAIHNADFEREIAATFRM